MPTPNTSPAPAEEVFFVELPQSADYLYAATCIPQQTRSCGVVMVPALGRERLRFYRETALLCRQLARAGYPVLRFDYRGEGESFGRFQDSTITSRVEDVRAAVRELKARSSCSMICLVGFGLGALVAALAAEPAEATRIIFCDPVTQPAQHARELLRTNLVSRNHYFGASMATEATLRETLARGESLSIHGFQLGLPLLTELETIDPRAALKGFGGRALLLQLAPKHAEPKRELLGWKDQLTRAHQVDVGCAVLAFSWTSRKLWATHIDDLSDQLRSWLDATT